MGLYLGHIIPTYQASSVFLTYYDICATYIFFQEASAFFY